MHSDHTIGLGELLRQGLRLAPHAPRAALATAKALTLGADKAYSIGALLEEQARRRPDHPAIAFEDQVYSFEAFNAQANRMAHFLRQQGVGAGDTVAVFMENRPEVLFAVAGIVKLGAIASMINTAQRGDILKHSLTLVRPRFTIVGAELKAAVDEIAADMDEAFRATRLFQRDGGKARTPAGYIDLDAALAAQSTHNPATTASVKLGQPAYYIFTSGTTGLPKASVMSHLRWMRACYSMGLASLGTTQDDVFYCCLPLYHNNALTLAFSAALGGGATFALARKFSASRFWDDIRHFDATMFCYIGELCRYLLAQPPRDTDQQHRIRLCVGNGLRPDIWDAFKSRFGIERINEFYGASEGNLVFTNAFNMDRTAGFCPMSFAIVAYDIEADEPRRDQRGHLIRVRKGETGLLITEVTDRFGFEGYTDPAASEKKLLRGAFKRGDCWFNTGDLVRDQGFKHIQFVDRLGDTFRWKGENVATTEVEAALNQWHQVEQSVVYGVEVPGADGRAGMAAITPSCAADDFDLDGFAAHVRESLPTYAMPLFLRLREDHEVTGTFKYRKVELKAEGFDPQACTEPLFAWTGGRYQVLDAEVYQDIQAGSVRI